MKIEIFHSPHMLEPLRLVAPNNNNAPTTTMYGSQVLCQRYTQCAVCPGIHYSAPQNKSCSRGGQVETWHAVHTLSSTKPDLASHHT